MFHLMSCLIEMNSWVFRIAVISILLSWDFSEGKSYLSSYSHNTTQKSYSMPTQGCYQYEDLSYVVRECLVRLDVLQLTTEQ